MFRKIAEPQCRELTGRTRLRLEPEGAYSPAMLVHQSEWRIRHPNGPIETVWKDTQVEDLTVQPTDLNETSGT